MNLLLEIREKDIGLSNIESFASPYKLRKAARAVLLNNENKIALLHVSKYHYHKLPGGGIEAGEDVRAALRREVLEEVGSNLEIEKELGVIIEYRNELQELQISYCFTVKAIGELKSQSFTDEEKDHGFKLMWVPLEEALKIFKEDNPTSYLGKFIQKRDLKFLEKFSDLS